MTHTYEAPSRNVHEDWAGAKTADYAPTPRQVLVIEVVREALAQGLFYTDAVLTYAQKALALTPEQIAAQPGRLTVEGGIFGMDCYYARCFIEARQARERELEAWAAIKPKVGTKLGTLVLNDGLCARGAHIVELPGEGDCATGKGLSIRVNFSRGRSKYSCTMNALSLRCAIETAHKLGHRKSSLDELIAQMT